MKTLFKTFLLCLLPAFAFGQTNVDSLTQALKTAPNDSVAYFLNEQLVSHYVEANRDSARYYAEKCIVIAQKNNKRLEEATSLRSKGYILMHLGSLSDSYTCFTKALELATNPENDHKTWMQDSILTPQQIRLGVLANVHHDFGHLMGSLRKTNEQIYHYNETKRIGENLKDTVSLGFVNMNLGNVLFRQGEFDSALVMEKKAEQIFIQANEKSYLGNVYCIIGNIFLEQQKNVIAVQYFHKGLQSGIEQNNKAITGACYAVLADFYTEIEKNKDSSLYYALKQWEVLESMGSKNLASAYRTLYYSYELNSKSDSAFKYCKLALQSLESTLGARVESLIAAQSLAFDDQLKLNALEKEKADAQNRLRTWVLLSGLGVMLLVGFLLYRNNRQKQKANTLLQKQKEEIDEKSRQLEKSLTELQATQAQLIQSEKLASLGELTAGIAHEIQNPLNFVNNFADVSAEMIDELTAELTNGNTADVQAITADLKGNLEKITHHGQRASSIVKSMLEHSRTTTGIKEPTNLNALADEYLRLAYHGLRAKDSRFQAAYELIADPNLPLAHVVPQDMGRVLLNLINNAFYAVSEKTKQGIEGYQPKVTVSTSLSGDKVILKVTDNGSGIPDAIREKIFQPFFTTKPTGQGTGLGLSLVYDIVVKGHGGRLEVESKQGEYSILSIHLPILEKY